MTSALERANAYLEAGADGVYVEGPRSLEEIEQVGHALGHVPLATSVLERGGVTPWLPPQEFRRLGFSMILYPTTVLFSLAHASMQALDNLRAGQPLDPARSVDMARFEEIIDLPKWAEIEQRFTPHKG
jgi:methylisocitrate lyase